jgi:hypothetical protein
MYHYCMTNSHTSKAHQQGGRACGDGQRGGRSRLSDCAQIGRAGGHARRAGRYVGCGQAGNVGGRAETGRTAGIPAAAVPSRCSRRWVSNCARIGRAGIHARRACGERMIVRSGHLILPSAKCLSVLSNLLLIGRKVGVRAGVPKRA